jgi:hypothetical protein
MSIVQELSAAAAVAIGRALFTAQSRRTIDHLLGSDDAIEFLFLFRHEASSRGIALPPLAVLHAPATRHE